MLGYLRSFIIFMAVIVVFSFLAVSINNRTASEGEKALRQAIQKASVQCYAVEGRYPSSVEYLEKNYGIQIDYDRYAVFYEGFASNIMPDITVVKLTGEKNV